MDEKPLRLRIVWTEPVPAEWQGQPIEFGLQQGRDIVLPGTLQANGTTTYETDVTGYVDPKGRLRYRGACVQGKPEEPFLYISMRAAGRPEWIMRAKALLTPLTEAYIASLPDASLLETRLSRMGHRPAGHVQEWKQV